MRASDKGSPQHSMLPFFMVTFIIFDHNSTIKLRTEMKVFDPIQILPVFFETCYPEVQLLNWTAEEKLLLSFLFSS